jgi:CRISPR-associated protein Csb2
VLVVGLPGMEEEVAWVRRALSGQALVDERTCQPVALLSLVPANEGMVRRYTAPAAVWSTVTPVILPGYDDPDHLRRRLKALGGAPGAAEQQRRWLERLDERVEQLVRKALRQAGFSEALAAAAEIAWRKTGFRAGVERAEGYAAPEKLRRFPAYHVRVRWRDGAGGAVAVAGPVVAGGGRFCGLGLFAPVVEAQP